ncbi:velvet factor-domain-containing protein [Xylariaceae sp. FL0594]|nr:velvet factor-domain-containing protein [Xylariaceae sp. FL0594]
MLSIQPDSNMANMMPAPESRLGKTPPVVRERRVTRAGRTLWYQLEVLQQPERARACGSGPKSSADRRPVDPPPVVVLRVLEGETFEGARDITFDYNVDFFCYASLEHARPMAHGRVQSAAATSPPVLTGFPVSGCCYLDRPDQAGYFLFPDLSVRHEGRYSLIFSLYELIKNEGDLDPATPGDEPGLPLPIDACHRMDLKSAEFTVYSAKKFPGLTESTNLSRVVADQGCRVRIRRDVRMRRRDVNTKPADSDEYSNSAEGEFAKRRGTQTPEAGYRARSVSSSSMDRSSSFPDPRPSNVEYPGAPPSSYQNGKAPGPLLNFGHANNNFAQPSYGPMSGPNPQSAPVSPAQVGFPQGQNINLPPPSPSYQTASYPPSYEHIEPEGKRQSISYPAISAKPLRSADSRPSIPSNLSTESSGPRPLLPSISFPTQPDSYQYQDRMDYGMYPMKNGLYPQTESRQVKRMADDSFPPHQHRRNIHGDAMPQTSYLSTSSYMRADGKKVYPPSHLWLN